MGGESDCTAPDYLFLLSVPRPSSRSAAHYFVKWHVVQDWSGRYETLSP